MIKLTIDDEVYWAKPAKVRDWLRLEKDCETDNEFNLSVMALCVVDKDDKPVFSQEDLLDMAMPRWKRVNRAVTRANRSEEDEKEQEKN